jgi:hypothetical protein
MAVSAYNNSICIPSGYSPNEIHFGRKINDVLSNMLTQVLTKGKLHGQFITEITDRIRQMYDLVLSSLKRYATQNEVNYNKNLKPQTYEIREKVLYFNLGVRLHDTAKWYQFYQDATIQKKDSNDVSYITLPSMSKRTVLIRVDKLKKFPPEFRQNKKRD